MLTDRFGIGVVQHHIQGYFSYEMMGQLASFQIWTCHQAPIP